MAPMKRTELVSPKRRILCSREHAMRVAAKIFDSHAAGAVSIIRTENPLQPYRVSTAPTRFDTVEIEMVS